MTNVKSTVDALPSAATEPFTISSVDISKEGTLLIFFVENSLLFLKIWRAKDASRIDPSDATSNDDDELAEGAAFGDDDVAGDDEPIGGIVDISAVDLSDADAGSNYLDLFLTIDIKSKCADLLSRTLSKQESEALMIDEYKKRTVIDSFRFVCSFVR